MKEVERLCVAGSTALTIACGISVSAKVPDEWTYISNRSRSVNGFMGVESV